MASSWAFLQPWREVLTGCLRLEPHADLKQRGVLARFEYWPDVLKQYQKFITADKCFLRVEFPTLPSARDNRQQLQRVREAVELFDRLAAVDNAAFASLLSEFLIHRLERRTGTPRRPYVVWPTWEFQLSEALAIGDAIESQSAVTWGQLFGCPDDPWETSSEFRAAMERLKALGLGTGGNRHNFYVSNYWQVHEYEMLMEGSQYLVKELQTTRPQPLSREMNRLFERRVPPVAHLMAVGDNQCNLMRTWNKSGERIKMRVKPDTEEAAASLGFFSQPKLLAMTTAIARTDMSTLKLVLFDLDEAYTDDMPDYRVNIGFSLSTLVCGRSLCAAADRSFPALQRSGKFEAWDVDWNDTSGLRFSVVLSAFAEATQASTLKLTAEYAEDDIYYDSVYWVWVVYAFWSRASRSSIRDLTFSWINLTEAHVAAVKKVLEYSFPEPAETNLTTSAAFGYVDIVKGTELRLTEPESGGDASLILAEDCRCRARYDSSSEIGVADVVVPGYRICKLALAADTTFIPETLGLATKENGHGIRSLNLSLTAVENNIVLSKLLKLVGKRLETLSLDIGFIEIQQMRLDLSGVASACPELKELQLRCWNVYVGDNLEALQAWGIKKLSIHGSDKVDGLSSCLRDRDFRMSSELLDLKISLPRIIYHDDEYVASLMACDGDVLPVTKEKLPRSSKCALISVVSGRGDRLQAVQYLDSDILSIIFALAAMPHFRVVQVVQSPSQ